MTLHDYAPAIITASWLLNAAMDAIDHGKGAEKLNFLWHALKWLSYAIPFGYIMLIVRMPLTAAAPLTIALWVFWEALYHFLRRINFHQYD